MTQNDKSSPEAIRVLIENHEKSAKLRVKWNKCHEELVNNAATFKGKEKGYTESEVSKSTIEAGLLATTKDSIEASRFRLKNSDKQNPAKVTGTKMINQKENVVLETERVLKFEIMKPVATEEKNILYNDLPLYGRQKYLEARSKLPKKRRRVLPVEQPRRKREPPASNRRVNAIKNPAALKELSPEVNKFGVNGMNMISLALQAPPSMLRPPTTTQPLQARAPIVESPIINTQSGAISLASLQPPLMTAPPLQPRPATTGALDLMLPLQPKLLPGYNITTLQSSFLTNTLSTVRPPDLLEKREDVIIKEFKPCVEVIVEKRESNSDEVEDRSCELDREISEEVILEENCNNVEVDDNFARDEINSNIIDTSNTSLVSSTYDNSNDNSKDNDKSPNNNSSR